MNYRVIAYAQDFVSFLVQSLGEELSKINEIILYGSVARGEATKESDIDIFIDTQNKEIEKKIKKVVDEFYGSIKFTKYWKLFNIQNTIKCIVGELKKWESLKRSIISDGFTLYGKHKARFEAVLYSLFKVNVKKKRNECIKIWRKLYGYKQKVGKIDYYSKGLIEEYGGKKLAKGTFIVPIIHTQKLITFFKENKIQYQIIEFSTDAEI